jgi:hypothetical protein
MKRRKIRYQQLPAGLTIRKPNNTAIFLSNSSLDWYKLTENTRHVLNQLLTGSAQKRFEESMKQHPDQDRIDGYKTISRIVADISRDAKNFESIEAMTEIIEQYAPLEIV